MTPAREDARQSPARSNTRGHRTAERTCGKYTAARKLLTDTDKLISDIATETGFWDQSHFVKAFRAERGQTPSRYRRKHRAQKS